MNRETEIWVCVVRSLAAKGMGPVDVADDLQVSEGWLRRRLVVAGARDVIRTLWPQRRRRGDELFVEWQRLSAAGRPFEEIAAAFGIKPASLQRSLERTRARLKAGQVIHLPVPCEPSDADAVDGVPVRRGGVVRWVRQEEAA